MNKAHEKGTGDGIVALDTRLVLFVGNLVPVKGADVLLEAWALIVCCSRSPISGCAAGQENQGAEAGEQGTKGTEGREQCSTPNSQRPTSNSQQLNNTATGSLRLLFIGDGPMRKELEIQAGKLGIADSVIFLGSRPHEEIALWMNAADCLCVPSRSEGMPNVVLEALASGLPIVATDVGAVREMLEGEKAVRVVEGGEGEEENIQHSILNSQYSSSDDGRPSFAPSTSLPPSSGNSGEARRATAGKQRTDQIPERLAEAIREILDLEVDRKAMAERHAGMCSWKEQAGKILELIKVK